jgi:UDP-N-acetylmuramoylalanine--D-glutamate ligase
VSGVFTGEVAVVVGFGASGRAAARVLADEGASVRVSEARSLSPSEREEAAGEGFEVRDGGHRPEDLEGATLLVASPGVPERSPVLAWASQRRLPIWSELELGSRLCRVPFVAVTGTNGKTTTTELVASMLRAAGLRARACGNVGYPFSLAAREPWDALAVEVSSFQLRFQQTFHPKVSVLLNVAPDHIDWHGSFEAYARAKARIFANQGPGDVHVGNHDDTAAAEVSKTAPCEVRWFGWGPPRDAGVGIVDGHLAGLEDLGAPSVPSRPFLMDAAAAGTAALAFGLPGSAVRAGLDAFEPLPHRGSVVARVGSVEFVDDSKATNPHAALAALEGRTRVILIAGGLAKGVDLSPLAAAVPSLSGVVAIGEAAPEVEKVFDGLVPVRRAGSMPEAVRTALAMVPVDGTVVLAPACASQDMFRDYGERGERFAEAARSLEAEGPRPDAGDPHEPHVSATGQPRRAHA